MMVASTEPALWQLVVLLLGNVLSVECVLRLPLLLSVTHLKNLLQKIAWTLRSARVSDHWKERAVTAYAVRLLALSLRVSAWVVLALLPLGLSVGWVAPSFSEAQNLLSEASLWATLSVVACLYAYARRRRG